MDRNSQHEGDIELGFGAESSEEGSEHVFDGDTWQKFEQLFEGLSDKLFEECSRFWEVFIQLKQCGCL